MTDAYETTIQLSRIVDNFLDRPNFYSAGPQASRQLNPSPSPGYCFRVAVVWLSGVMVGALDSRLNGSRVRAAAVPITANNPGQTVRIHVPTCHQAV